MWDENVPTFELSVDIRLGNFKEKSYCSGKRNVA
jgi:hypothetical protein